MKFYLCKHCLNEVMMIKDSGVNPVCCSEAMKELVANSVDAAKEKHVPEVSVNGNNVEVSVGSVTHPMSEEHYIEWIVLESDHGYQINNLKPGEEPKAMFSLANGDKALKVYAYCNLHGLWVKEL